MILLLMLLIGSAWAFFIALELDRPDLIAFLPTQHQLYTHGGFIAALVVVVVYVSWFELTHDKLTVLQSTKLLTRNCIVLGLGVVLLIFISRELLHGIDPTGRAPIWNGSAHAAAPVANLPHHDADPAPPAHPQ